MEIEKNEKKSMFDAAGNFIINGPVELPASPDGSQRRLPPAPQMFDENGNFIVAEGAEVIAQLGE